MSFEWLTDWLPFTFYYLMVLLLFLANLTSWVSILFLVPGNWIMVFLSALFYLFMPGRDEHGISLTVLVIAILLAGLGEVIEALGSSGQPSRPLCCLPWELYSVRFLAEPWGRSQAPTWGKSGKGTRKSTAYTSAPRRLWGDCWVSSANWQSESLSW